MGQEKTQRENSREQRKKDREDCRRMSLRVILWGSRVRGVVRRPGLSRPQVLVPSAR